MAIIYQNGTVVSVPDAVFPRAVCRASAPVQKCFGINFKTKMKIFDAAHIQHLEMSNAPRFADPETGELLNADYNHVFLTPTFDQNDPCSYLDGASNEAVKRFTDNLTKRYQATSYVWVKEFTKLDRDKKGNWNGLVPHYHMLVTMPRVDITQLNRAWSHARGDISISKNALRTGWDARRKRSVMKVRNYRQAVGYAAKYISKADAGDISVFRSSCSLKERKTWEARTGHSTKCYGMSQNLHRQPKRIDLFLEFHLRPWLTREVKEVKSDFCDLFFFNDYRTANDLYQRATEIQKCKPVKTEKITPSKPNYTLSDQTFLPF